MIFSLRQLQEKCREQRQPLYIAFIDLTKAFDLVIRQSLLTLLQRIGCPPPKLLRMITSFHEDKKGTVQYDGSSSEPFPIKSGVKQGCALAPALFGIFFSLLLSHAFKQSNDVVYLHSRSDGKLYNLARLRATTKVRRVLIREMLFADDAALTSHTEDALQRLIRRFEAHVGSSASQSVSRRPTSWGKMSAVLQTSPSATTHWKWWMNLSTLAPPSPATSLWTPSSTPGLARPQQQWPALQQEYADHQHQDEGLPSLRAQHTAVQQWNLGTVLPPRTQTKHLSSALPQADSGHLLARPCPKQASSGASRNTERVGHPITETPALARSCQAHAGW